MKCMLVLLISFFSFHGFDVNQRLRATASIWKKSESKLPSSAEPLVVSYVS